MEQLNFLEKLQEVKKPICPVCVNSFDKTSRNQKYCSKKCAKKYRIDTRRINHRQSFNGLKKSDMCECKNCGKEFEKPCSRSIYCSLRCSSKARLKLDMEKRKILNGLKKYDKCICPICGNTFEKTSYNKKCCSLSCGQKKHYKENRDKINKRKRLYAINNPDIRIKRRETCKRYQKEHPEKRRSYEKEKIKNDPVYKFIRRTRSRIKNLIKEAGCKKIYKTIELLGCTALKAKEHIEKQFKEGMTWENHGFYGWHIDHIIPCASFDLTDPKQQKKCFHYTNLQPLWAKENISKGAKIL